MKKYNNKRAYCISNSSDGREMEKGINRASVPHVGAHLCFF
jgi:hypothetical protein